MTTIDKEKKHYMAPLLTIVPLAPQCMFQTSEQIDIPLDDSGFTEDFD